MGFSEKQVHALERAVSRRNIRTRMSGEKELSYLEGWYVIATANRIFGSDGWDRETLDARCVLARDARVSCLAIYTARVRVTVRAGGRTMVREGHGTGEGRGSQVAEAHDLALKTAETDATKRALVTFGKAFGLALYANGRGRRASVDRKGQSLLDSPMRSERDATQAPLGSEHPARPPVAEKKVERAFPAVNSSTGSGSGSEAARSPAPIGKSTKFDIADYALPAGIDKSVLSLGEPRRVRDKEHLRFVASQPCVLCSGRPADAHHLRFAQPRALGRKVGDEFTVPLCRKHHRELHHGGNEAAWWHNMGIDPIEIARQLWHETVARRQAEHPSVVRR